MAVDLFQDRRCSYVNYINVNCVNEAKHVDLPDATGFTEQLEEGERPVLASLIIHAGALARVEVGIRST